LVPGITAFMSEFLTEVICIVVVSPAEYWHVRNNYHLFLTGPSNFSPACSQCGIVIGIKRLYLDWSILNTGAFVVLASIYYKEDKIIINPVRL
jgi:hypothetical protein